MRLRLDPVRGRLYLTDFLPPYSKTPYEVEFGQTDGTVIGQRWASDRRQASGALTIANQPEPN